MAHIAFLQLDDVQSNAVAALGAWLVANGHSASLHHIGRAHLPNLGTPNLLAFSLMAVHEAAYAEAMAHLRREHPRLPVVVGGVLATVSPGSVDPTPDYLVRGEGEAPLLALAEHLDGRGPARCDGLHRALEPTTPRAISQRLDLRLLPQPDHGLHRAAFSEDARPIGQFIFSRGCAFSCSFCYAPAWNALYSQQNPVRRRTPVTAIEEIVAARSSVGFGRIRICDDNFGDSVRWLGEFSRLYRREVGLPFACYLRSDLLRPDRIKMLADAGCVEVGVGVETWDERLRSNVLKKRIPNSQYLQAAELLRDEGIALTVFLIVGLPGETLEQASRNVAMLRALRPDFVWTSRLQVYPGTQIETELKEQGRWRYLAGDYTRSVNDLQASLFRFESLLPLAQATRLSPRAARVLARLPVDGLYERVAARLRRTQHARSLICSG